MSNKLHRNTNKLSKLLLAVTLLLSVFVFQGSVVRSPERSVTLQTALFVNSSIRTAKNISFKALIRQIHAGRAFKSSFFEPLLNWADLHSKQLNTRFKNLWTACRTNKHFAVFYRPKTIPQSGVDNIAPFLG
jgi:hypothetical protein